MTDTRAFDATPPDMPPPTYRVYSFRRPVWLWFLLGIAAAAVATEIALQSLIYVVPQSSNTEFTLNLFRALYFYQFPIVALLLGWVSSRRIKTRKCHGQSQFAGFADAFGVVRLWWLLFMYFLFCFLLFAGFGPIVTGFAPIVTWVIGISFLLGLPTVLLNAFLFVLVAIGREDMAYERSENRSAPK